MNPLTRFIQFAAAPFRAQSKTGSQMPADPFSYGGWTGNPGLAYPPAPEASIRTYRKMLCNPTVQLALAAAKAPIKSAEWSVETDDGVADTIKTLVEDWVLPLRAVVLRDGLRAVEFGYYPFEVVWEFYDGYKVPVKLKPLLPELTEIVTDEKGRFVGLRNMGVELNADESLLISLDGEAGNYKGRSRLENVREKAWWPWECTLNKTQAYVSKASGIIPRIQYPAGESVGPGGNKIANGDIAKQLVASLANGGAICMPRQLEKSWERLLENGVDPEQLIAWKIDFIDPGAARGGEFESMLNKFEALIARGLLQPERSILEGQYGTKAEAESHGSIAVDIAQETSDQLMEQVNWHLVDKMLRANFGEDATGTVRVKAAPLSDSKAALLKSITTQVLTNPANLDLLLQLIDMEQAAEQAGLPVQVNPANAPITDQSQAVANQAVAAALKLAAG